MSEALLDRVRALVGRAQLTYAGVPEARARVDAIATRLHEPLRIAVAGRVKSGKSTLLNALVGEPLAPTDAAECTRIVTWYQHGRTYRADLHPRDGGPPRQVPLRRGPTAAEVDLEGTAPADVARLVVSWPSPVLERVTFIDTPGLGSLSADVHGRALAFLTPDDDLPPVDALVYLARHVHAADVRLLEAFHDDDAGAANPVNAIGVLGRADEIGGASLTSLDAAARVADRYRADPHLRRLCQTVVPVAGLLAQGATQLTEADVAVLRGVAADEGLARQLCRSADAWRDPAADGAPDVTHRAALLDRLGVFGVRLAVHLLVTGEATTASGLVSALADRSGLPVLRRVIDTHFAERAGLLKARAAIEILDDLVTRHPPSPLDPLAGDLEALEAGAHELAELRLLVALRSGALELPPALAVEADEVLSTAGRAPAERGVPDPVRAIERWRRARANPLASPDIAAAADVVIRTYEGILAGR